jgi:hypothetical protein
LFQAPPPGKLSPDRDGSSDPDADKKGLDCEIDMLGRGNSEKKGGERIRRGLDIDLEDQKVQRIPADEFAPKKLTLQLDLEKPSLGDEKSPSERRQPQPPQLQQQKPSKSEVKHEKSGKCLLFYFCIGSLVLERCLFPFLDLGFSFWLQQCLLLHHLCQYLLEAGWGVSHRLVTLVQSRDYQQLVFIPWTSSQGLLAGYSMLRCFHRQHAQSDVLHIATLHNLSSTNSELQR